MDIRELRNVDLEDLNRQAREWIETVAHRRVHGTTFKVPGEEPVEERQCLRPSIAGHGPAGVLEQHSVRKNALITVDQKFYSVPPPPVAAASTPAPIERGAGALQRDPSYKDFIAYLVEHEVKGREVTQLHARTNAAKFGGLKHLEDFDFGFQTSVSRQTIMDLAGLHFVKATENVCLCGPSGVGKTIWRWSSATKRAEPATGCTTTRLMS